jgi:uncharacterized protein DUF1552
MFIAKMALPRRTFLRGMGITLALPLLDAMVPALSAIGNTAAKPVKRLGFVYIPMGSNQELWAPKAEGRIAELSPTLSSLTPFLDQVTVISNLEHRAAYGPGNHGTANCTWLSGVAPKYTDGPDVRLGITVDQIAAQKIGATTQLPSLELATDFNYTVGQCDNGLACVYMNTLSWTSDTTPIPNEANPRVVFERMFGDGGTLAERKAELRKNASILDRVNEDMASLQRKLGPADRTKVTQYVDSIREIERRIQMAEKENGGSLPDDLTRPVGVPAVWEDHVKLMFDLQVLALQADITRVITFQLAREVSTRTYPEIGVPEAHHPVSHHQNDPVKLAKLAKINAYHTSLFAYLLEKMKATPDGDGTLLDHSMYLLGSGLGNPDVHDHTNLPILVAGGAAGALKGGRHIKYAKPVPMANLLLTMLDKAGIQIDKFADSNGEVEELLQPLSI